jgi:uncharacterized protein (TIGR02265 family)
MARSDISELRGTRHNVTEPSWVASTQGSPWTNSSEDWASLSARIEAVPARGTIRGMFMRQASAWMPGGPASRYLPFANYSLRDYMQWLLRAAAARFPRERAADALVQLGREVYPLFASSLVGGAIFGIASHANNPFRHAVELSTKAYPVTLSPGHVNVVRCDAASAFVELRDVWVFPEFFHTGIWLGAMALCKAQGTIAVTRRSACDVDFRIEWRPGLN